MRRRGKQRWALSLAAAFAMLFCDIGTAAAMQRINPDTRPGVREDAKPEPVWGIPDAGLENPGAKLLVGREPDSRYSRPAEWNSDYGVHIDRSREAVKETAAAAQGDIPTYQEVYEAMMSLKETYPEGMTWTNFEPYGSNGKLGSAYTWKGGPIYGARSAVGCMAFVFILSDTAFGSLPARPVTGFTFEDVKVGDILRVNGNSHSVIVLQKSAGGVTVAEANYHKSVHWGRAMSADAVEKADFLVTRYPEGYSPWDEDDPEADAIVGEGTAGDLKWSVTKAGVLTVSGDGDIPDYSPADPSPWSKYNLFTINIEEGVTGIGDYAFYGSGALSAYIPDTLTAIGQNAFAEASLLAVTIPGSVKDIGNDAFYMCANLTSATVSEGVEIIGERAFQGCTSLAYIDFPASITSVGAGAFTSCSEMVSVRFKPGGGTVEMGDNLFTQCWKLRKVTLPLTADRITAGMFASCSSLPELYIPASVQEIGENPFTQCRFLRTIKFGGSEAQWNSMATPALKASLLSTGTEVIFDVEFDDPFVEDPDDPGDFQPDETDPDEGEKDPSDPFGGEKDPSNPDEGEKDPTNPDEGEKDPSNPDEGDKDPTNPDEGEKDPSNPDEGEKDPSNPDEGEKDPSNPDEGDKDPSNPDEGEKDPTNPDEGEKDPSNPDEREKDPSNPDEGEKDPSNPDEGEKDPSNPDEGDKDPSNPDEGEKDPTNPDEGEQDPSNPDEGDNDPSNPDEGEKDPSNPDEGEKDPTDPDEGEKDPSDPDEGDKDPSNPDEGEKDPSNPDEGEKDPSGSDEGEKDPSNPDEGDKDPSIPGEDKPPVTDSGSSGSGSGGISGLGGIIRSGRSRGGSSSKKQSSNRSRTTTKTQEDGTKITTTTDAAGNVEVEVSLSVSAVTAAEESGKAVPLPVSPVTAAGDMGKAWGITVHTGRDQLVNVSIPVVSPDSGTVAVMVNGDGSAEVIKNSVATENSIVAPLSDGVTVKIVDNGKNFSDIPEGAWYEEAADFVSARDLFRDTAETAFAPDEPVTYGVMITALADFQGMEIQSGGSDPNSGITCEQSVTMLWRCQGSPAAANALADQLSDEQKAMAWAAENGIISSSENAPFNPQGQVTRGQAAQIIMNFAKNVFLNSRQ